MAQHCLHSRLVATLLVVLACTFGVLADILRIDQPTSGQNIPSNLDNPFTYTILGAQANGITDAYYPNSLTVDFQWIQNGNESNVLKFNAISSLPADPSPAGVSDKQYSETWKTPSCHFFTRYQTSDYSFSLVVTPQYTPLAVNQTAPPGPEQEQVTVPINIQVNNGTFPRC